MRIIIIIVMALGSMGCEETYRDPTTGETVSESEWLLKQQREQRALEAGNVAAPPLTQRPAVEQPWSPLPDKAPDLRAFLAKSRKAATAALGKPTATDDEEHEQEFRYEGMDITILYRGGKVWRVALGRDNTLAKQLLAWLNVPPMGFEANGTKFTVETDDQQRFGWIAITDTSLPRWRIQASRLLGAPKAAVERVIGRGEDVADSYFLKRERVTIRIDYWNGHAEDGNRSRRVEIGFGDGVHAQQQLDDILKLLRVRPASGTHDGHPSVVVGGRKFAITADKLTVNFERRFL